MLQKLYIRNYAIIEELSIHFDKHLNVITGETGAGKSIILGAISLILGERADSTVLINAEEKCVVEAQFDTSDNADFRLLIQEHELDEMQPTIIRREITAKGKSRAFVNDTPVTLNVLNELTACLVDLHRQFDNTAMQDSRFMYQSLDAISGTLQPVRQYQQEYEEYKQLSRKIEQLRERQSQLQKEADYNQFLYDELEEAAFKEDEIEQLDAQLQQLNNAELIQTNLSEANHVLMESEWAVVPLLRKVQTQLQQLGNYLPDANTLAERMQSCYEELKDIAAECSNMQERVEHDPQQLMRMQERYDLGYRLLKKHGLSTTQELLALKEELSGRLSAVQDTASDIEALAVALKAKESALMQMATAISERRHAHAAAFAEQITGLLHLVGMPNAAFSIALQQGAELSVYGLDQVQYLFDANKSGKWAPVQKVASGGELSRIMLSIKALTAKALQMPTLIFDEVDTGISGEAAKQVGVLLRDLGQYHQILCITHQPQVAGKGNQHLYVYKTADKDKVTTQIKILSQQERIELIATMIGGASPSEAALKNARELVEG
ncbi:MAG TPA: DNA repair protein RecN [Edaphocola sp.]|nr:DNA repair protein RecN [Edaphocola sp.]